MKNIIILFIFGSITSSCFNNKYNDVLRSAITKIVIENRAIHRYGGIEKHIIKDRETIDEIYTNLVSLSHKSHQTTKPFEGSVLIKFYKDNEIYETEVINNLTTSIIFKENDKYFITFSKGQFISDDFLKQITDYLHINRK